MHIDHSKDQSGENFPQYEGTVTPHRYAAKNTTIKVELNDHSS